MSGLRRFGVDANPFGSKYSDKFGGFAAGNGQRTYTKPSYTLFVTGIPDAESSDAVQSVFEYDQGFLQCRPVGHKSKRMVFVDYDTIEHATKALQAHQGWKWEPVDEGLKIDYDQDARCKRNTALDLGLYEKFYAIGPRTAPLESESEMFARLKAERAEKVDSVKAKRPAKASMTSGPSGGGTLGAKILIRNKEKEVLSETKISESKGLVQYSSSEEEVEVQMEKRAKTWWKLHENKTKLSGKSMFDKRRGVLLCISRFLHRVVADSAEVGAWENPQSSPQKEVHRGRGEMQNWIGEDILGSGQLEGFDGWWKIIVYYICAGV